MPEAVLDPVRAWRGVDTILARVRFFHRASDGSAQTYYWSGVYFDDADGNAHDPRVLRIDDLTVQLSDRVGNGQAAGGSFDLSDLPDPITGQMLLRGFLGNEATVGLMGVSVLIEVITAAALAAGDTWIPLFRGLVREYALEPGFRFVFEVESWLQSRLEQDVPLELVGTPFPGASTDDRARVVPWWYGTHSDELSTDLPPAPVANLPRGFDAGPDGEEFFWRAGFGDLPGAAPTVLNAVEITGGELPAGTALVVQAQAVHAGVGSNPFPFLGETHGSSTPVTPTITVLADGAGVALTCDDVGADLYRFHVGQLFSNGQVIWSHYLESATPDSVITRVPAFGEGVTLENITQGGGFPLFFAYYEYAVSRLRATGETALGTVIRAFPRPFPRPVSLWWTQDAADDEYYVYRRDPGGLWTRRWTVPITQLDPTNGNVPYFEDDLLDTGVEHVEDTTASRGVVPTIPVGQFRAADGSIWLGLLVGVVCKELISVYQAGERIEADRLGGDWLIPGQAGFSSRFGPDVYRTVNGRRYTLVYALGPSAEFAQNGTRPVRVNLRGIETVGDASGTLIDSLYDQLGHVVDNAGLLGDTPWAGAAWGSTPIWADSTPRRNVGSFTDAKAVAAVRLPAGDAGAWGLTQAIAWRQLLADLCVSGHVDYGLSLAGQLMIVMLDPDADPVAHLTETSDILRDSFRGADERQGFANVAPFRFRPSYDDRGGRALSVLREVDNPTSIARYPLLGRILDAPVDLVARRSLGPARQVAARRVTESGNPARRVELAAGLHALHYPLGALVTVDHREGASATGWTARRLQIRALRVGVDECLVRLTTRDVDPFVTPHALLDLELEEWMAERALGGSRLASCVEEGGRIVPYDWWGVRIDWDTLPVNIALVARVLVATSAGTIQPRIIDADGNVIVTGSTHAVDALTPLQELAIPRVTGVVEYRLVLLAAGGAAAETMRAIATIDGRVV